VDRVRRGTHLPTVLEHLRAFLEARARAGLAGRVGVAVFTALAADTAGELAGIADAVAPLGVDALMVTDLNFPGNQSRSLHRALSPEGAAALDGVLRGALVRGLPVLSVHALEELGLPDRFRELLVLRGARLAERSPRHTHCRSPWQALPVAPDGTVTLCDCQPGVRLGNLLREPFSALWNGAAMRAHRRRMASDTPPPACASCPRY
jgi:radical SAM protein with 4Fe4S-binding SPASM domain